MLEAGGGCRVFVGKNNLWFTILTLKFAAVQLIETRRSA